MQGSWHFGDADAGGTAGGRLYATAMSCLCLEETFRHLPTFRINAERRFAERFHADLTMMPADKDSAAENDEPEDESMPQFRSEPDMPPNSTVGD